MVRAGSPSPSPYYVLFVNPGHISRHMCADGWLHYQDKVQRRHGQPSVIAAMQFYSDKTQVTMAGRTAHPIRFCLLNTMFGKRVQNLRDIGYFPNVPAPTTSSTGKTLSVEVQKRFRLTVTAKCLTVLLEGVLRASYEGLTLKVGLWQAC